MRNAIPIRAQQIGGFIGIARAVPPPTNRSMTILRNGIKRLPVFITRRRRRRSADTVGAVGNNFNSGASTIASSRSFTIDSLSALARGFRSGSCPRRRYLHPSFVAPLCWARALRARNKPMSQFPTEKLTRVIYAHRNSVRLCDFFLSQISP